MLYWDRFERSSPEGQGWHNALEDQALPNTRRIIDAALQLVQGG